MLRLSDLQLAHIRRAAERAYPEECCGLLVGHDGEGDIRVTRVVDSPNVHPERTRDRFEVDPKIRLDLERELRGTPERIVGHFHSHPDHPAMPSETDRTMAFEPALIWVIVAVVGGGMEELRAFKMNEPHSGFDELEIGP